MVDVQLAVEMVALVLQTAGQHARPVDHHRFPVHVDTADDSGRRAVHRGDRARHRQTALLVRLPVGRPPVTHLEHRVDDMPDMPNPVGVIAVVDEKAQVDADLVGRQADTVAAGHGGVHVVDQRTQGRAPELGDLPARTRQHVLADRGDPEALPATGLGEDLG